MKRFRGLPVVCLVVAQLLAAVVLQPGGVAAQDATSTYTDPNGRFTMQWEAPWEVVRQDQDLIMLSNGGSALVIPVGSLPLGTANLDSCLPALANATGDPAETSFPVLAQGRTTWRSWIAYQNDTVGLADYFECQIVPGGDGMAAFVGGASLSNFATDLEALTDFIGHTIVQPNGEHAPALTTGGWRAGVVAWSRGSVYKDLGLAAQDGKAWVVVVVDVTNQRAGDEAVSLKSFGVRDLGGTRVNHASTKYSNAESAALGEAPIDGAATLSIPRGAVTRVMVVFAVDRDASELALSYDKQKVRLEREPGATRFGVFRPPTAPVAFEKATVDKVIDGRTVAVTLDGSGETATVQLIGLAAPTGDECYAAEATAKLAKLAGTSILLETDGATPDGKSLQRHVWSKNGRVLIGDELVRLGYATATDDTHRFQAMFTASESQARAAAKGLWAGCQGATKEAATATPGESEPPTAAQRAYLSSLQENLDILVLSLSNLKDLLQDGAVQESEANQLAWVFIGLGTVEKSIRATRPPARYEPLQTAYLTALEPLTTQARAEADLDAYLYGDATSVDFYDFEIDAQALSDALDRTTTLLAEANAQFDAAQTAG
jgi:endonuclease YncB( thermonuclease family)